MKKIIQGRIVTPEKVFAGHVLFDETSGRIESVGEGAIESPDYIFDDRCLIFPGMGDIHVHCRDDVAHTNAYKEDFITAGKAALNGGVTFIADMPNNPVSPVDDVSYEAKGKLASVCPVPVLLYAGIGPGTLPLSKPVPYKVYMGPSIGDLFFKDSESLDRTLARYKGCHVSFHCEDAGILESYKGASLHSGRHPVDAETVAVEHALDLIAKHGLIGILCHLSCARSLELVRSAKKKHLNVACEVTPQHLYFASEDISENNYFQLNPPIRGGEDRDALREAFVRGEIDFLATDHAPHSMQEKAKGISGLSGLDTFGSFTTWAMNELKADSKIILRSCCTNPGAFFNRFSFGDNFLPFGKIASGYRANFTIIDVNSPFTVTEEKLKTKCRNSPFCNMIFPGRVKTVFLSGHECK